MSDILGTGIWGSYETPVLSRGGAPENFSEIHVSAIKNKCILRQKHLSIWVLQGIRETNLQIVCWYYRTLRQQEKAVTLF